MTGRPILVTGKQLAQLEPADTNAASLYSPGSNVTAEIGRIFVANTTAGNLTYRIFHDDDGTTYDTATAIAYDIPILANRTTLFQFEPPLWMSNPDGNLAVRSSSGGDITFTLYGLEHED